MYPAIHLSETVSIPTYYLIISLAVCVALIWVTHRAEGAGLNQRRVLDISLIIMCAGFVGGRLLHVFYEEPSYYKDHPFEILSFWNGGFVFYGGALLAGLGSVLYVFATDRKKLGIYADLFAPVAALTYALGRGACFLAGCCYGKFCELPWAVAGRHPTQIYAALWELGTVFILLGLARPSLKPGFIFSLWMVLHGMGRLLMELFRDDFRGPTLGFSLSSWISLAIIAVGFILIFKKRGR